jgi:hypothetical protein
MNIGGISWRGESIEDVEILPDLPGDLVRLLNDTNGFILHEGAVHVRGACGSPDWHSLRAAWRGERAFHLLYDEVQPSDIPFAQDQLGDQFLIRDGVILRLAAETGDLKRIAANLEEFLRQAGRDPEGFLNVGLNHKLEPGQLLHAFPPFCFQDTGMEVSFRGLPADQVIQFHANLAKQIRDLPDGGQIELNVTD